MKVLSLLPTLALLALMLCATSCETTDRPRKKKVVPPDGGGDISGLPWNRPQKFESGGGLGRMMPQSR